MNAFPIHDRSPIQFDADLPDTADCVVIGGGIIGVMAAWELTAQGQSVVLLEKGRVAGEQSSRNWGWVRVQGRDPAEIPIMLAAREIWKTIAQDLDTDIGLRSTGVTYLARSTQELGEFEAWLAIAKEWGLDTHLQSKSELASVFPNSHNNWHGGLHTPSDMRAEPWLAVPTIARALKAKSCTLIENCAARTLETSAGCISSVATERGEIKTNRVILAGGAWSSLFLRRHNLSIPQLSVRETVVATQEMPSFHDGAAAAETLSFRRRIDGGYTLAPADLHELLIGPDAFRHLRFYAPQLIRDLFAVHFRAQSPKNYPDAWGTARNWQPDEETPFERMRILNPTPNHKRAAKLIADLNETFPHAGEFKLKTIWSGMIDTMPDVVPVVDNADQIPGLTIATGMSGHGFGIGPAFGKIAAQLALGQDTGFDLLRFRLSRFFDGSKLDLGPSL